MNYMIVNGKKSTVTETVNEMMKDGWEPCGGISITNNGETKYFYAQAMVASKELMAKMKDLDECQS